MSHVYTAVVSWSASPEEHRTGRYSRRHEWRFDGGEVVAASAGPDVPGADPTAVDPEEALVAAVSSCHMLFFLSIAQKHGLIVTAYEDEAEGVMSANERGKLYVSTITLRPKIAFEGAADPAVIDQVHHLAHDECYLANSIRGDIVVQPR